MVKYIYLLLQNGMDPIKNHSTCFGCQTHPSSGLHKTVTTASGTGHIFCAATFLQRGQAWPRWREVVAQKI